MVVRLSITCARLPRQCDRERRALAKFAANVDRSTERVDDLPSDPEAQSETAATVVGRQSLESREQSLHHVRRDADAAIRDGNAGAIAVERDVDIHRFSVP